MANVRNRTRTIAMELCLSFNFGVVFDVNLLPVPPSKAQFIGNVLMYMQNVAISFSFITRIAYWRPESNASVGDVR
jgi:hypothetical protein